MTINLNRVDSTTGFLQPRGTTPQCPVSSEHLQRAVATASALHNLPGIALPTGANGPRQRSR